MKIKTLAQALKECSVGKSSIHYIISANQENTESYSDLWERALRILHQLQIRGLGKGHELILFLDDLAQFVGGFWASILGGITPVPLAAGRSELNRQKLFKVFAQLQNPYMLTSRDEFESLGQFSGTPVYDRIKEKTVLIDELNGSELPGKLAEVSADDISLIQFSSGSTGDPKGVVLTHKNILSNIDSIVARSRVDSGDRYLSWMPLYHDMGLIGFHLTPTVMSGEQYLMPTSLFVRRPVLWLKKISDIRATVTSSPNFGYQHVLSTFNSKREVGLDLSSVRLIFNGAEPISARLCRRFVEVMSPLGLNENVIFPVYGLAEASLAVAFPDPGDKIMSLHVVRNSLKTGDETICLSQPDSETSEHVCVGTPLSGSELKIFNDNGDELPEHCLGHIKIRGANVTRGYYHDIIQDNRSCESDRWLDTGDLGFFKDRKLYIAGRVKELIIINGLNFHPADLETLCLSAEHVKLGNVAACRISDPTELSDRLAIFVVFRGSTESFVPIVREIKRILQEKVGVEVSQVLPISRLPRTSSGKLQRFKLEQDYAEGEFLSVQDELKGLIEGSPNEIDGGRTEELLLTICNSVISDRQIGIHDNLFEVGASSLNLAQIHEQIDRHFPNRLEITDMFDYPSISELAQYLENNVVSTV